MYKAKQAAQSHNVYYTAHLFSQKSSQKQYVLPTRTIQADLDYADVYSAPIPPTILVETSPGRAQSYWILKSGADYALPTEEVERLSRKITYAIPDCDRTGWPLGHRLRLPDTFNHKYPEAPHITILSAATRRIEPSAFDLLPDLDDDELAEDTQNNEWVNQAHFELDIPPTELINTLSKENKISARVRAQYNSKSTDRSEALWQLMCELFSAGLGRDIVYHLAFHSDNNKFADRAYGATRDLRKDVLRAELHINSKGVDVKASIIEIRKDANLGSMGERLTKVSKIVINSLRGTGSFYHTRDGRLFYVHRNIGKPIPIPSGGGGSVSEWLSVILTHEYGINSSQSDARFVTAELQAHVKNMPPITEVASLSHYDDTAETLLVHSGNKDVYAVTREGVVTLPNGNADVLFNWSGVLEPFRLDARPLPNNRAWHDIMFSSTMETATNVTQAQGTALMTVWFLFLLFRNIASTRPILALLGQPGSGKSACFRKIYRLLYGKMRDLHQVTSADDFDIATSSNPLVVYDNLDTFERWLPDRMAMATTASEIEKRKLFTDQDTIVLKRTALIGATAHSPKFLREDIADRLLVITFERRPSFQEETTLLGEVSLLRNSLWASILADVQRVLDTPRPSHAEVPSFRIQDFAAIGLWIARGINLEKDFLAGLQQVKGSQSELVIEEEFMLVSALRAWVEAQPTSEFVTATELFQKLPTRSADPQAFHRMYKSGVVLGKKLFVMANALKSHFNVEWDTDSKTGTRIWKFGKKETR